MHDSQVIEPLLIDSDKGQELYADNGYSGKEYKAILQKYGMRAQICEKGYRYKKLIEQKMLNSRKNLRNDVGLNIYLLSWKGQ